jgi:hypothetical protein
VTTSGDSRVFSAWSIAATSARGCVSSIGDENTRRASVPHAGHAADAGAVPSG